MNINKTLYIMYNLRKNDVILFNPERSPFGAEEICIGIVVTPPDWSDVLSNHGASFEFQSPEEYYGDSEPYDNYIGRTGRVIYNFGAKSEEQLKRLIKSTQF